MVKVFKRCAVLALMASAMVGCQSVKTVSNKDVQQIAQSDSDALIYCAGTENCTFARLDETEIIDAKQKLSKEALKKGLVRLNAKSVKDPNALYLSVPAGQHELVVRFYPISPDKAETLYLIHHFKAQSRYTLTMYRDRHQQSSSLLSASAPHPLCVDLKQQHQTIRRFCKPYNVLNGLGEFVEQKNFKPR